MGTFSVHYPCNPYFWGKLCSAANDVIVPSSYKSSSSCPFHPPFHSATQQTMKWPLYLCGLCSDDGEDATGDERQPLLSGHEHDADDTALQHRLRQKLQTFQMLQATTRGYLPSTKQVTAHVRTFLEAPSTSHQLSPAGQKLSRLGRLWLTQLADLLQNKNGNDQVQDFAWYISRSSISADLDGIRRRAATANDTASKCQHLHRITHNCLSSGC